MSVASTTDRFSARMERVKPSAIRELLRHGADPSIISFGGGYPDPDLFPIEELHDIYARALLDSGRDSLQYTVSNGPDYLRDQIARRMAQEGVTCTADEVLILHGGQQGLDLVAKLLVDPGDVIITENPTFLGALIAFNPCEPRYVTVPMDADGMDTDALAEALEAHPAAKVIYTVSDFQNPTGVSMSPARRQRLIELANRFDVIVLEDSPYRETRFEGDAVPPIKSLDTEGRVIYLGSFSKVLAPGMRMGWAVAPAELIEPLGLLKLAADTQCSTLNMAAVSLYLDHCDIAAQLAAIRATYRRKKNLMLDAIGEHLPGDIGHTDPQGGLFTWLTFPAGFDSTVFMRDHALPEAKVAYVPGATFFPVHPESNHARVSYSTQSDDRIVAGIAALGRVIHQHR